MELKQGNLLSLSLLRTFDNGRFKAEKGETMADLQVKFLASSAQDRAKLLLLLRYLKSVELADTMEATAVA